MLTNPVHILSVAALLLAAFLVGAIAGTILRRALSGRKQLAIAAPAQPVTALPASEAVTVPEPAQPSPQPASRAGMPPAQLHPLPAVLAIPTIAPLQRPADLSVGGMMPARVAGETTSGRLIPAPLHDDLPGVAPPEATDDQPLPTAEPEVPAVEPPPAENADDTATYPASAEIDELAAMRAVEGNWTPRRPPRRPVPVEVAVVDAEAPATVQEPVGAPEIVEEPGRPNGLASPRGERRDALTHIIGVLPVIEVSLNQLGIYHFDQVAALTDENIGWIEGHLGIPGRIARELWREQARELAAVTNRESA